MSPSGVIQDVQITWNSVAMIQGQGIDSREFPQEMLDLTMDKAPFLDNFISLIQIQQDSMNETWCKEHRGAAWRT